MFTFYRIGFLKLKGTYSAYGTCKKIPNWAPKQSEKPSRGPRPGAFFSVKPMGKRIISAKDMTYMSQLIKRKIPMQTKVTNGET